jgi:hypothetical protein
MPRSSVDAHGTKKQKLGHSDPSYTRFNFVAMSSPSGRRAPDLPVGSPEARSAVGLADRHACRGTPHPLERPPAVSPACGPSPAIATHNRHLARPTSTSPPLWDRYWIRRSPPLRCVDGLLLALAAPRSRRRSPAGLTWAARHTTPPRL